MVKRRINCAGECKQCGAAIPPRFGAGAPKRYCSHRCSQRAYSAFDPPMDHPSGVTGAIGELIVAADLLRRGHYVYRALTPSAPFDLAIWMPNQLLRIEVTKARRSRTGKLIYNAHDKKNYDVIAVWEASGVVTYLPDLASFGAGPLKYSDEDGRVADGEGVGAAGKVA